MLEQPNLTAFFYARWDTVEEYLKLENKDEADDIRRQLIMNAACPAAIRISAWQVRSLCTDEYYEAVRLLKEALKLCDTSVVDLDLDFDDPEVKRYRDDTLKMMDIRKDAWTKQWKARGRAPPTEEDVKAEQAAEQATEQARLEEEGERRFRIRTGEALDMKEETPASTSEHTADTKYPSGTEEDAHRD